MTLVYFVIPLLVLNDSPLTFDDIYKLDQPAANILAIQTLLVLYASKTHEITLHFFFLNIGLFSRYQNSVQVSYNCIFKGIQS